MLGYHKTRMRHYTSKSTLTWAYYLPASHQTPPLHFPLTLHGFVKVGAEANLVYNSNVSMPPHKTNILIMVNVIPKSFYYYIIITILQS